MNLIFINLFVVFILLWYDLIIELFFVDAIRLCIDWITMFTLNRNENYFSSNNRINMPPLFVSVLLIPLNISIVNSLETEWHYNFILNNTKHMIRMVF